MERILVYQFGTIPRRVNENSLQTFCNQWLYVNYEIWLNKTVVISSDMVTVYLQFNRSCPGYVSLLFRHSYHLTMIRHMHKVSHFCVVVGVGTGHLYPYPSGLLHCHRNNHIQFQESSPENMGNCIHKNLTTATKQSTIKLCSYSMEHSICMP